MYICTKIQYREQNHLSRLPSDLAAGWVCLEPVEQVRSDDT